MLRTALLHIAKDLPQGDSTRRKILAVLKTADLWWSALWPPDRRRVIQTSFRKDTFSVQVTLHQTDIDMVDRPPSGFDTGKTKKIGKSSKIQLFEDWDEISSVDAWGNGHVDKSGRPTLLTERGRPKFAKIDVEVHTMDGHAWEGTWLIDAEKGTWVSTPDLKEKAAEPFRFRGRPDSP